MLDEERPLVLVFYVPFSALTLMVGWQEGHPSHKKSSSANPGDSAVDQVDKVPRGNCLTQILLVKQHVKPK